LRRARRPASSALGLIGAARGECGVGGIQLVGQGSGQMPAQAVAGGVQGIRIDHIERFGQRRFAGQGEGFGDEGGTALGMGLQQSAGGSDEAFRPDWGLAGGNRSGGLEDQLRSQALAGFPGIERVAFVGQQKRQLFRRVGKIEYDRRREIAEQRRDGFGGDAVEVELLRVFAQEQRLFGAGDDLPGGIE
jgi:hypothetical protein